MKSYRDKAEDMLSDWMATIMAGCGKIAEANCKELCPVDTGRLRNSITYEVSEDGKSVIVGTNVEYASEVEFDDRKHHVVGQSHYMRDGIIKSIDQCNSLVKSMGVGDSIKVD